MEEEAGYEFKIDDHTYTLKIQLNSSDKLLFTLKKNIDNELMYYKKELQFEELLRIFDLKENRYSSAEKIHEYLKKAKQRDKIKIKLENDKAKFILIKINDDYDEVEYPFDFDQCIVADQELNKTIIKDLNEIKEKIEDMNEIKEEIIKIKKENQELKDQIIKLKENEKNEIDIIVKVDKEEDINKKINFLCDVDFEGNKIKNNEENFNENIELYIENKKEEKFEKFFCPKHRGAYKIKLVFKKLITDCSYMFADCKNILGINFKNFNSKEVKSMKYMFTGCVNLERLDLSSLDTRNVTDMEGMFGELNNISKDQLYLYDEKKFTQSYKKNYEGCKNLKEIILCETDNVKNMANMFSGCLNLQNLVYSSFCTKNVTDMTAMFFNCTKLEDLNLSFFNTENVTNMSYMFYNCCNLPVYNLISLDTTNLTNAKFIFCGCQGTYDGYRCYDFSSTNFKKFDRKELINA